MAYVPPALRKRAQEASSPYAPDGATADPAGSLDNLPPGMAPPRNKSAAEPLFSLGDIHDHYWDPENQGKRLSNSLRRTLNASAQEPDRLDYIVLFRDANPRWESHGVIFAKSNLHILPGGERFREEQLKEAEAVHARDPAAESGWGRKDSAHGSQDLTGEACIPTDEAPSKKMPVAETQVSDESQHPKEQHPENEIRGKGAQGEFSGETGNKRGLIDVNTNPDPEPEPPYSPDLSLYPPNPIAVFEQVSGAGGRASRASSARFRFAGYHRIASLEYLPPHSRELFQLLEQKWTKTDSRGRLRQAQRKAELWKGSLKHRWAVIQMERDQEADDRLAPPEVVVRDEAGGAGDGSSGKSVNELLAEMRLKG